MQTARVEDRYLSKLRNAAPRPYHIWFKIVDEVDPNKPEHPSIRFIQNAVCEFYMVDIGELRSNRRHSEIVIPRHMAMYLCKELTLKSFPTIGAAFGMRDHSSPIFGFNKINRLRLVDEDIAADIAALKLAIAKQWGN